MKTRFFIILAAISYQLLAISYSASSCPLCQAGATKKTQAAYLDSTFLLMLLPIISGAVLFFWLRSKYKGGE
jgi:hypothetical protein